ncbi:uncharacterized protein V1516DRAFT_710749 [Lipomyces oligophaga]|uniref:uncharacterized protein n=1 Tax=Lipomyces oligophaga TaxID=45792 RepID=UPI0034CE3229
MALFSKRKPKSMPQSKSPKQTKSNESTNQSKKRTRTETRTADEKNYEAKSKLKRDDPVLDFPRGGSSVLTPLEYKEAANEAVRDVLFESSLSESRPTKKSKIPSLEVKHGKLGQRLRKKSESTEASKPHVKIEGLSFKKLIPGTLVLGQVSQINDYDITLSLPNMINGYIPITRISDQLSNILEEMEQSEADSDDDNDDEGDKNPEKKLDIPTLSSLFKIGQWLRAIVVEKETSDPSRSKKHITLSIKPEEVNSTLDTADLNLKGVSIQASVSSIEDHGVILDVGIPDKTGFISNKELAYGGYTTSELVIGQTILLSVLNKSTNGRTLTLTATGQGKNVQPVQSVSNVDSLVPGTLVDFIPTYLAPSGLAGQVAGLIDATADLFHSGLFSDSVNYKENHKVKARVIACLPTSDSKCLRMSLLPQTLEFDRSHQDKSDLLDSLPIGHVVEMAKVTHVEPGLGLFFDLGLQSAGLIGSGFAHISRLADKRVDEVSPLTGSYKLGTIHTARITGKSTIDGLYTVSLQPSVISQRYLSLEDILDGDVIDGAEVVKVVASGGLLVQLSPGLVGHVNELNLSDVKISQPERRFRPGMKVKVRVLQVQPSKRRIRLTLKKSLVNSDIAIATSYENVEIGQRLQGTIVHFIKGKGAIIEFFGSATAFLPVVEMTDGNVESPEELFKLGQTVTVQVISINAENRKMTVSCREKAKLMKPKKDKKVAKSETTSKELENAAEIFEYGEDESEGEDEIDEDAEDEILVKNDEESEEEEDLNEMDIEDDNDLRSGLKVRGFDWTASLEEPIPAGSDSDSESDSDLDRGLRTKRRRPTKTAVDITGDLSTKAPESVSDFERMLIGNPNSSSIWIRYMAFQIQLGEIEKGREIAKRALKTIAFREETQKLNIWVALLNLENTFGTEETLQETFKESCVYMDPDIMAVKLKTIQKQRN